MVTWPQPRPFQGRFVTERLGHAKVNLPTKFEVPILTRYRNIKGDAKCRQWGGLGWLGVTLAYRQCHHSIGRIRFHVRL